MRNKVLFTFLATLALTACAATGVEKPHSFRTGKDYTVWKADPKIHYVMGLADAFTYLSVGPLGLRSPSSLRPFRR